MLIGVWNSQDRAMIRNVTRSAWGSPGSESTARQLVRPDGWMVPMPSQVVKLSSSTPTSGINPKTTKNASAGSASQLSDRCRRPREVVGGGAVCGIGGATAVTYR